MFNLNNKYIAFGTKEGFVEIFRLRDQKMVALLSKHNDSINFITACIFWNKQT